MFEEEKNILQDVISIFMSSHTDSQSHDDRRSTIAHCEVEAHWTVINIAHFSQHSIEMNAVDGCPCKGGQPRVVKSNRNQFAGELF